MFFYFIALVTFLNKIDDHTITPETYIIPSSRVRSLFYHNPKGTRQGISHSAIKQLGDKYREAWDLIK